jgi:hypothetical protein
MPPCHHERSGHGQSEYKLDAKAAGQKRSRQKRSGGWRQEGGQRRHQARREDKDEDGRTDRTEATEAGYGARTCFGEACRGDASGDEKGEWLPTDPSTGRFVCWSSPTRGDVGLKSDADFWCRGGLNVLESTDGRLDEAKDPRDDKVPPEAEGETEGHAPNRKCKSSRAAEYQQSSSRAAAELE